MLISNFFGKNRENFFCHVDKSKIILMVKLTKNYFFPHVDFDKWFIFCLTGVVIGEKVKSGLSSSRLFTSCRNWVFSFLQAKPCHICLNKWHVSFCYCKLARSIFSLSWWSSLQAHLLFFGPRRQIQTFASAEFSQSPSWSLWSSCQEWPLKDDVVPLLPVEEFLPYSENHFPSSPFASRWPAGLRSPP